MEDEESFTVIDVYQPYYDLVWVYISEGKCETHYAADREIKYNVPPFLKGVRPSLSHLVSGQNPAAVSNLLEGYLRCAGIKYVPIENDKLNLFRFVINKDDKDSLELIVSKNFS